MSGLWRLTPLQSATAFPWRNRFKGEVAEGRVGNQRVLLLRPMTYMNLSGTSVQEAAAFYKIAPDQITAFHDELTLPQARCG